MKSPPILALAIVCLSYGCGSSVSDATLQSIRVVTLPDGAEIKAEVKVTQAEMAKGMMYRDSIPNDQGMLFVHGSPGIYPYWMANCKFPLDIIWMNSNHEVVEISPGTPPCPSGGSDCPNFGGHVTAQYVLELSGGQAARHNVQQGSNLKF